MQTKKTTKAKAARQGSNVANKLLKVKTEVHRNMKVQAAERGVTIGGMLEEDYSPKK